MWDGEGRVHLVDGTSVTRPGLLHPLPLVPELAADHVPPEEDIADGTVGLQAADVGDSEAPGHLLA